MTNLAWGLIAVVSLLAVLLWWAVRASEREACASAQRRLMTSVHEAIASRLGVPAASVAEAMAVGLEGPLRQRLTETVAACETVYTPAGSGDARVTVVIRWKDGGTTQLEQNWRWETLPAEVRSRLLRAPEPVHIPLSPL